MTSIKLIYDTFYCIVIATRIGAAQSQRTWPNCLHKCTDATHIDARSAVWRSIETTHCHSRDEANGILPPAIFANSIDFIIRNGWKLELYFIYRIDSHNFSLPAKSRTQYGVHGAIEMKNTRTTARLKIQPLACRRRWLFGPLNLSQFSFPPRAVLWQREEWARLLFVRIKRTAL